MTTYVLVHGAWGGAHGWRKVRHLLRAAGQEVFTPALTGIGERSHLASPQVNLSCHITDVVNTILYEDLRDIVLLGFSYGGFVVTGALEHIASRVAHLVYLSHRCTQLPPWSAVGTTRDGGRSSFGAPRFEAAPANRPHAVGVPALPRRPDHRT